MTLTIKTEKPSPAELAENYLIHLDNCAAIALTGEDKTSYLQGQVTCDVNALAQEKLLNGAHCNAKGKVFSCFRVFEHNDQHLLFQPKTTIDASLAELKKFGVFAKVDINLAEKLSFYALVGPNANKLLKETFGQLPDNLTPVIHLGSTTLVYLAGTIDRYLLIDDKDNLEDKINAFSLPIYSADVWRLLEIEQGMPFLEQTLDAEFVPQMLNMQAINGISFTKGCYLGQETVARMQYLGRNKKALFRLSGELAETATPLIIEKQIGENWRRAGEVTAAYVSDDKQCYLQAVMANDIDASTNLRIKDQAQSKLTLNELPYSLNQE